MFITRLLRTLSKRMLAYWWIRFACPDTLELGYPLIMYSLNGGVRFGAQCEYDGTDWGIVLGDECRREPGTIVLTAGAGRVVYSKLHPPRSDRPLNWGNLVVIAHCNPDTKEVFFSVYGGLARVDVAAGDLVLPGRALGIVADPLTDENGGWEHASLFFGIYTGPWNGNVIPGYYRADQGLTRPEWWHRPIDFIEQYRKE